MSGKVIYYSIYQLQGAVVGVANYQLVRQLWISPETVMCMRNTVLQAIATAANTTRSIFAGM